mmetsp:Transcript_20016/g.46056  ORF Transcript_20016/g.46056 Transcript_20016/m.46056 type:complete len:126 (-) Transcript_20016:21-398(-)
MLPRTLGLGLLQQGARDQLLQRLDGVVIGALVSPQPSGVSQDDAKASVRKPEPFSELDIILCVLCLVALLLLAVLSWRYYRMQKEQRAKQFEDKEVGAAAPPGRFMPPTACAGSYSEDNTGTQSI